MAYSQADLDRIDAEIASTNARILFGDKAVFKKGADELLKQRAFIADQIAEAAALAAGTRRVRHIRMFGGKGF